MLLTYAPTSARRASASSSLLTLYSSFTVCTGTQPSPRHKIREQMVDLSFNSAIKSHRLPAQRLRAAQMKLLGSGKLW